MSRSKKSKSRLSVRPMVRRDTGNQMLCKTYMVNGFSSFSQLMDLRARYSAYYPECTVLFTLDDRHQMEYTAFHSANSRSLDNEDIDFDESVSDMNPMPPEFFDERLRCFMEKAVDTDFTAAFEADLQLEEGDHYAFADFVEDPLQFIDDEVAMIIVPNNDAALGFCVFPVGYFTVDLNPFQNYAMAKHFEAAYGYRLIGIGACMLGFLREDELSDDQVNSLVNDLAALYHCKEISDFAQVMATIVREERHLFIKYGESME
jgi:hypothetical protein